MKKDFDSWNRRKKIVHQEGTSKYYHTREIWWCSLGINVGYEQDGGGVESQRPVLILKGLSKNTCLVIPLTRSTHSHKYRIPIGAIGGENATALISQMRVIDTKRLVEKIGFLNKESFEAVRKTARGML